MKERLWIISRNPSIDDASTLATIGIRISRRRRFQLIRVRQGECVLRSHLKDRIRVMRQHPGAGEREFVRIAIREAKQKKRRQKVRRFQVRFGHQRRVLNELFMVKHVK